MSQSVVQFSVVLHVVLFMIPINCCPVLSNNLNGADAVEEAVTILTITLDKMTVINTHFDSMEMYVTSNYTVPRAHSDPVARPLFLAQTGSRQNHRLMSHIIEAFAYAASRYEQPEELEHYTLETSWMLLRMLRINIWKVLAKVKRVKNVMPTTYWNEESDRLKLVVVQQEAGELKNKLVEMYKTVSEVCAMLWQQVLGASDDTDYGCVC